MMNKIFRIKTADTGLSVRLDHISSIQYTIDGEVFRTEIMTMYGPKDATLTAAELEALTKAWDEAL